MTILPLPRIMLEPIVRATLLEDLGRAGDLTTDAIVPADRQTTVALVARQSGVVAGLDLADLSFGLVDPGLRLDVLQGDGSRVEPGTVIARLYGPARGILTAERTALNLLGHLSGVATATAQLVAAVAGTKARIVCTRKTLPGLRAIQKHAVRLGGGANHRFGLDDAILIKDNHIAIAGGVIPAIKRARAAIGHLVKLEVEVDTLSQLAEVLTMPVDAILLDNMSPSMLQEAVRIVAGKVTLEASGGVTLQTAPAIAASGVDLISAGWLTHSSSVLDIGLDQQESCF